METVGVGADVVESHLSLGLLGVGLEEHGLSVPALGAGVVLHTGIISRLYHGLSTSDLGRVGSDTTSVTMFVMASTSCMILLT